MKRITRHARLTLLALLLFIQVVNAQQVRSTEEVKREAGRIVTAAERLRSEAYRKAGNNRTNVKVERQIAESFEKAIELWREAGDYRRLTAAVEELTRIYSVIGDYERVVHWLTRQADFWRERGDSSQQAKSLFLLGIRQSQMRRDANAVETYQRVIEMSRSGEFYNLGANALSQLAISYDRLGRVKEAEAARLQSKEWFSKKEPPGPAVPERPSAPVIIPTQWIDLPGSPLGAEYRVVDGVNRAVLVNRSSGLINMVSFGCVALETNNKVRVLHGLMGFSISHGGVGPGLYFQPFGTLNGPMNQWTDEKMSCEGPAKMTVIEAGFEDGTGWKAEGSQWVVR